MMIKDKDKSDYLKILGFLLMAFSSIEALADKLDDQDLAEQSVGVVKLSPIIIKAVKEMHNNLSKSKITCINKLLRKGRTMLKKMKFILLY